MLKYLPLSIAALLALSAPVKAFALSPYLDPGTEADRIVIEKKNHTLTLMKDGKPLKIYKVALGRGGLGKKEKKGDLKTPEGLYKIENRVHDSKFYLALKINYPSPQDIAYAKKQNVDPGSNIMIHGLKPTFRDYGARHRQEDWTEGCVAVTDSEILEIWDAVPDGTPVEIKP